MRYDIAVIGGGPGGYTAAVQAAEEGFSVVLFEKDKLGGTCLNRGCIPTKALLYGSEMYEAMRDSNKMGIVTGEISCNMQALHSYKEEVVNALRKGIDKLLRSHRVTVVYGHAQIAGKDRVVCNGEEYAADNIIIATGSVPAIPPIPGAGLDGVYTSNDLLEGDVPDFSSLIIIGGGVIGVESASIYLPLGKKISMIEAEKHILPNMDKELAQRLTMILKKRGASVETEAKVTLITGVPGSMTVEYTDKKGKNISVTADGVLIATGRRAATKDLFLPGTEPDMERDAVYAEESGRTSIPRIYVIGDARAHNIQLAHLAEAQGKNVAAIIAGKKPAINEKLVPSCLYTNPEIASVGLTEAEANEAGYAVKCAKALTGANGKCLIEGAESGYVKLVAEKETGRLLGAQLLCPRATDMVAEISLAIQKGLTANDIRSVIHPHPTFSEMTAEAAGLI